MKKVIAAVVMALTMCSTVYGATFVDGQDVTVGHVCERVEKYNSLYDETSHLHLLSQKAVSGEQWLEPFELGPGGYYTMTYERTDTSRNGRRVGNYYSTKLGNIYYANTDGTIAINGMQDGYVFDDSGVRLNTTDVMFAKYKDEWYDDNEYIYFDSLAEGVSFVMYMHTVYGLRQDDDTHLHAVGNKYRLLKQDLINVIKHSEEDCKAFDEEVHRLYEKSLELTYGAPMISVKCRAVRDVVAMEYDYDLAYTEKSMADCIRDKKGVCYHYAKLYNGILKLYGIDTKYVLLNTSEGNHVIVQGYNEIGEKFFLDNSYKYLSYYDYLEMYSLRKIKYT